MAETSRRDNDAITVGIVPHTHWDREWYAPFQTYRVQLVHLIDELLDLLERDDTYARFLLDGQTAVLDDYLEIRPEAEPRLAALVGEGRVQIGPWMVLMDEFMVSGETIVRDLQLGVARARAFGGPMPVGYLPDMFGHIAQMPQILRLAGLEHAVVWRGVPAAIACTGFWWQAPDGSRVRAEYLYGSYSNGRDIPDDGARLVARAHGYELEVGDARVPGGGLLLMNGSDHLLPQPWLGRVVDDANARQRDYQFTVTSLSEYLDAQPDDGLPTWHGELRSGARANVLMGVASNRVDVHQLAAAAERTIEKLAEPLSTLFVPSTRYPAALLGIAWRHLVLNSAHDSSCACSHDDVVEAVRVRYEEARHIGDALSRDALLALARDVDAPPGSTIVVNPTTTPRGGLVAIPAPGTDAVRVTTIDGDPCPTQIVATTAGDSLDTTVSGSKIRWVLEMMRGPELAGARVTRVERRTIDERTAEFTFHNAGPGDPEIDLEATRAELLALGEAGATVRIRQRKAPVRDLVFAAPVVAGFGWRSFRLERGESPSTAVVADGLTLANEHVTVIVDPYDGTFTVEADGVRIAGANRFVDGGDGGDTYNYSPPEHDVVIDRPETVAVEVIESGPVRARLVVTASYTWPARALGDERSCAARSDDLVATEIRTTLELRTGERFLRIHVELDNRARDHRLRTHIPLPAPVTGSHAECAFAVVARGLTAEGGPHEAGLPTFVSRRFVDASDGNAGVALLHDGLLEYEITDDGRELALTLTRAVGYLSRSDPALRPNPAGPLDPLEGPQLQRRLAFDYAVLPHHGDWFAARLHAAADEFLVPLARVRGGGWPGASRRPAGAALTVEGAQVSAVHRADGDGPVVVRLFNATPDPAIARVMLGELPALGNVVDLLGAVVAPFTGELPVGPWTIATVQLISPTP
jgi:hypothetical protein